ncbi:hypothetical protein DPEC_G00160640 [Dallia pectoralis]|uniref:Uncharacterized protein n=1 Tax=Dallia pectoralis TaxID=75939 RepID=A0ACC2GGA0_DALPE|nr:hypothetical protein DPEC_G00160640 [Dallia pectoralis]
MVARKRLRELIELPFIRTSSRDTLTGQVSREAQYERHKTPEAKRQRTRSWRGGSVSEKGPPSHTVTCEPRREWDSVGWMRGKAGHRKTI